MAGTFNLLSGIGFNALQE